MPDVTRPLIVEVDTFAIFAFVTAPDEMVTATEVVPDPVASPETVMLWFAVRYDCDLTYAVVANDVELSDERAVTPDTAALNVFDPVTVCVPPMDMKYPSPPIAMT